jgi:apolipoprotein N-acyltransferase
VASGTALALAGPPVSASAAAFLSPALLLAALLTDAPRWRMRRALLVGLVAGTTANAIALFWVVPLLQTFARFPWVAAVPTALVLWVVQGLPFALAAAGACALSRRGAPAWLVLPASLTVAFSITPALFPWRPAASQVEFLPWVQLADVGGPPLLDLLWALAGCAVARAVMVGPAPSRVAAAALAFAAVVGPLAYGMPRMAQVRAERAAAPTLRVGVVQPNVGIFDKHEPLLWPRHLALLQEMTRGLEDRGADLVVWPETAYPYTFPRDRTRDLSGPHAVRGRHTQVPLLFGAITQRSRCERWNSVLAMDPEGEVLAVADKRRLLAFGETVPLWHHLPPLRRFFPCPGLTPGTEPGVVHVAGAAIGVLNCYEDILALHTRWLVRQGSSPALLVNATNDAWFGDTSEPHLHHHVARLRAVETRRDLVRAVNTGVSGHVLATGEDAVRTPTWVPTSFVADARLLRGRTIWVRLGDLTSPLLGGALLGTALALRRRRGLHPS